MKYFLLSILLFLLTSTLSFGQVNIDSDQLNGTWIFESVQSEIENCQPVGTFPIKNMTFKNDNSFTMADNEVEVIGKFEISRNELRFYDVMKNGVAQNKDQKLKLIKFQNDLMTFELPMECGPIEVTFMKEK